MVPVMRRVCMGMYVMRLERRTLVSSSERCERCGRRQPPS